MKKLFILYLLLCVCYMGYGQVITVLSTETNRPVEMASIVSNSSNAVVTTNADGQADISAFSSAPEIKVFMVGYKTLTTSFDQIVKSGLIIYLENSNIEMDEIVISATRWSQVSKDLPSKIITISSADVALQNPQTAADMLGASGEIFIQKSQQGGGSPMIRGFSTNRLLYSVDGIRMNTAIFRSGNLQNVISLDPFAIEKTEIYFGPGSVIYGSDAIGGVMSFTTLTPQLSLSDDPLISGKAVTRYSTANQEKTAHFDVNVGWKKWASVTSFSSNNFGDLRMGSNGPDEYLRPFYVQRIDSDDVIVTNPDPRVQTPSGYSQINLMQKVRFTPNENWDFQYGFHFSETSEYARYDRHVRYRDGLPRYGEWNYGPQVWMMNNLNIMHTGNNKIYDQLTLRLAVQNFEESRIDRNIDDFERHIRIEDVDATSVNLDLQKSISEKHQIYYGAEFVSNDVTSIGIDEDISTGIEVVGPARYPQATWASYAAYINYHMSLSEKFMIQAGARYNAYSLDAVFDTTFYPFPYKETEMDNGAITGSLGFVFRPNEKLVFSANFSTGFRSPNVDDAGKVFDSEPGSVIIPNPDLEAEYAYNGEIGIAKVFGDAVKIDLTGYYTVLQNALVRRDFTLNGEDSIIYDGELSQVQAIQNAAVATVYGIQAGIDINLGSGFGISSDYNYQVGEEELDNATTSPSRHAPPAFGISRLTYTRNSLSMQFYAVYSAGKEFEELPEEEKGKTEIYAVDEDGNPYSPSWYTVNFKVMYNFTDNLSISGGMENLTDQRYRPYSSGIVAPGRNLVISLRATF